MKQSKKLATITRNNYLMLRMFYGNKNGLLKETIHLRDKLGLLPKTKAEVASIQVTRWSDFEIYKEYCENFDAAIKRTSTLKSGFNKTQNKLLVTTVNKILKDNHLGNEWRPSLEWFILDLYFHPPVYNFDIQINSRNKVLSLVLNGRTTIEDIKEGWPYIQQMKKAMFKDVKSFYANDSSLKQLELYEKMLDRKLSKVGLTKNISDLELVSDLFPDEADVLESADRKRASRIRTIRKRYSSGLEL